MYSPCSPGIPYRLLPYFQPHSQMPKKSNHSKTKISVSHASMPEHQHMKAHRKMNQKMPKESTAASKIQNVHVSNNRAQRSSGAGTNLDSEKAAVGVMDPFAAFSRQYKTGLPFSSSTLPSFGFWTRNILRSQELQFGATAQAGVCITVCPWGRPLAQTATVLDAAGAPTATVGFTDQQHPFIIANFQDLTVAYQGVRVRNLTPVLNQGGETTIGIGSYVDNTTLGFDPIRASSSTITHSNGDPGVICQMSYYGNPSDNPVAPGFASDYRFTDASITALDPQARTMAFRSFGIFATPQIFEIEIVTYYLGVAFSASSQLFAPTRYDVTPSIVNRLLDVSYSTSPMLSIPRNFIKDDGWDTLWTGAKAIIKDIGLGLIGSAASWVGSAFASIFDARRRHLGFKRLMMMLPDEAYDDFKKLVVSANSRDHALSIIESSTPSSPSFTPSQLLEIAAFMRAQSGKDFEVVSTPASAAPGWKGVFSR